MSIKELNRILRLLVRKPAGKVESKEKRDKTRHDKKARKQNA